MAIDAYALQIKLREAPTRDIIGSGLALEQLVDASGIPGIDLAVTSLDRDWDYDSSTDKVILACDNGWAGELSRAGDFYRYTPAPLDFYTAGTAPGSSATRNCQIVVERNTGGVRTRLASKFFTLTVRRTASFSPLLLGDTLFWVDAYDLLSTADAAAVAAWSCRSRYGRDLAESTNTPTKRTLTTGHPVVRFDGTNDILTTANAEIGQPFTAFFVGRVLTTDATERAFLEIGGTNPVRLQMSATQLRAKVNATAAVVSKPTDGDMFVGIATYNATNITVQLGSGAPNSQAAADANARAVLRLGDSAADSPHNVDVAEVAVVSGVLSAGDIERGGRALAAKWGVTW